MSPRMPRVRAICEGCRLPFSPTRDERHCPACRSESAADAAEKHRETFEAIDAYGRGHVDGVCGRPEALMRPDVALPYHEGYVAGTAERARLAHLYHPPAAVRDSA